MNIFEENDYRKILRGLVEERKAQGLGVTFQSLAEAMRMPKSYLSSVIHGKASLSADQVFLAAGYLRLADADAAYVQLLVDHDRSAVKQRKDALALQIKEIQARHLETKAHIKAKVLDARDERLNAYFGDPVHQIVHVCLAIPRFAAEPAKLAQALQLPLARLMECVARLEEFGVVEQTTRGYQLVVDSLHLPPESPFFGGWRSQLRVHALQRLNVLPRGAAYSFSVSFAGTRALKAEIQRRFLEFLKELEPAVGAAASDEAFQLNFDLFSWTSDAV